MLHTVREAERLGFTALVVTCDHPHEGVKRRTLPSFEAHEQVVHLHCHTTTVRMRMWVCLFVTGCL